MRIGDDANDHIESTQQPVKAFLPQRAPRAQKDGEESEFSEFADFLCGLRVLCGKQVWLIASC